MLQFGTIVFVSCLVVAVSGKGFVLILGGNAGLQFGAYNTSVIQTPNLDSLAQQGVLFTNAHTNNVAGGGASISTFLSGLPSHQNGQFGSRSHPSGFQAHGEVQGLSNILSARNVKTGFIGVKTTGPENVFKFDYSQTEANNDIINIGRNITLINEYVNSFLNQYKGGDFFLVISLGDPERCKISRYGQFCENFGDGTQGMGSIPDWKPVTFDPSKLTPPYFITRSTEARRDLADLYRSYNRLDQGVGLYLRSIQASAADTLVAYTSTGGLDFPGARYSAWRAGTNVPLIVAYSQYAKNQVFKSLVSTLDMAPTVLDFFGVPFPPYTIFGQPVSLTGSSLLPILRDPTTKGRDHVFLCQDLCGQINQDFPIRGVKNGSFTLIRNSQIDFPVSGDIFNSPTFQYIISMTHSGQATGWWRQYTEYIKRLEFELYDHSFDPYEVENVAYEPKYAQVLAELKQMMTSWQLLTQDPWICDRGYVWTGHRCAIYW